MPTGSTALEIIKTAMRHLGVIATGETPSAAEAADGLSALNDVLETWNTEGLSVWSSDVVSFTATPGVPSYTIGPTGTLSNYRPVRINGVYALYQGVEYAVAEWTYDQYMSATVKATSALYPTRYAFLNDYPDARIFLFPVPAQAITLDINMQVQLSSVANLATVLSLPPGYVRALQWDLAAELAPQYGLELTRQQMATVTGTKAAIKRANRTASVSSMDPQLTTGPLPTWQGG